MIQTFRKLRVVVVASALAFLALPGAAQTPNKHFSLTTVTGTPDSTQQDTIVTVTVFNDNPSGSNAQIGSFTLSVANESGITITGGEPDPAFGGLVSLPFNNGTSISVTGFNPLKAGEFYTLRLHVRGCGDGNLWSAVVWSGSNLNGGVYDLTDPNNLSARTTDLACGALVCSTIPNSFTVGGASVSGVRGSYNKDGSLCTGTRYYVSNLLSITGKNYVHFRWDADERVAAFRYTVGAALANVAWIPDGNGAPIFVPALACDANKPELPAPYGTLIADNGGKQIKVDISTAVYPLPPMTANGFPIVIEKERMQVMKVSGQTWTVVRGAGNTTPVKHPVGKLVMSTPLPIIPDQAPWNTYTNLYAPGNFAQMCIPPGGALPLSTTLMDIGDGWSRP